MRTESPRPAKGSTSPGKCLNSENKNYDGPTDWDEQINEHRKELQQEHDKIREQQEKEEQDKDVCWELHELCREFLDENSKDWAKVREKRINEKNRILRLEKQEYLAEKPR